MDVLFGPMSLSWHEKKMCELGYSHMKEKRREHLLDVVMGRGQPGVWRVFGGF